MRRGAGRREGPAALRNECRATPFVVICTIRNAVGPSLRPPPTNYIQSPAASRMREWCIGAPTLSHYSCMLPDR